MEDNEKNVEETTQTTTKPDQEKSEETACNGKVRIVGTEEFTEEQLQELEELIEQTFCRTYTFEEALYKKSQEDLIRTESFRTLSKNQRTLYKHLGQSRNRLISMKIQTAILKQYTLIANNGRDEILQQMYDEFAGAQKEIQSMRFMLRLIKKVINCLKRHRVVECNLQLSELLQQIYDREQLIAVYLKDYIQAGQMAVKGIQYYMPSKNQEALEENMHYIENSAMALGLVKQTQGDK